MQNSKSLETLVGLFVVIGIGALLFLGLNVSNLASYSDTDGYTITARFENSGGLKVRSPVSVSGVRIGRVTAIDFDNTSYESVVQMKIGAQYNTLPDDSSASIFTAGLLGEQYIGLQTGASEEYLTQNSELELTQSAIVLEEIIGQFLFSEKEN
ncbi:MAG: outer membrane lipid asymmetry maintenance protein MlaD [Methylococcales bacterium]|nr:outer membrane lipid asymmetry maintenance protein MlaD [Methylococcaceae bacterium]HIL40639.1 outer membrane lipid asymmetry maintenance protein MlaD [Methylococcales bacterium]